MTELRIESVTDLLDPLASFWSPREEGALEVERLDGDRIPEPYRGLLVHDRDMTPTLEAFWESEIALEVLAKTETDGDLLRHVILRAGGGQPAAFGAIRIHLAPFPEPARAAILECREPLGGLLRDFSIPHQSAPTGFFRMRPNAMIRQAFGPTDASVHYGRHNRLSSPSGLLAEVVEVLPLLG